MPADHYFLKTMILEAPEPRHKLCYQQGLVSLQQRGPHTFLVRYGKEIHSSLDYTTACFRLGQALMHQLTCDGLMESCAKSIPPVYAVTLAPSTESM